MSEYINMENRNWGYAGDKGTWARRNDDGTITVKLAAKGTVSRAYCEELREFCAQYGQDFDAIRCGESITFPAVVETAEEEQVETQTEQTADMDLIDAIRELMTEPANDNAIYSDGVQDWTLDNLYDAVVNEEPDGKKYILDHGDICTLDENGYIAERIYQRK